MSTRLASIDWMRFGPWALVTGASSGIGRDLTGPRSTQQLAEATADLDLGLVVVNAGAAMPGEFLSHDLDVLRDVMRLNAMSCLEVAHHFGGRLAQRGHGGMVLVSAADSRHGVPNMANDAATKAYVLALGKGLHTELGRRGVSLTVLLPGATDTPALERFGIQPGSNRVFDKIVPAGVSSMMMGRMASQWGEHMAAQKADVTGEAR